jgi:hypothetical protein
VFDIIIILSFEASQPRRAFKDEELNAEGNRGKEEKRDYYYGNN